MPLSSRLNPPAPRVAERVMAACVLLLGAAVALGWILHVDVLVRIAPGLAAMKFNTALAFMLAGSVLLWRARFYRWVASLTLIALASTTLLEYVLHVDARIDDLVFASWESGESAARMAPQTAVCFFALAVALILRHGRRYWYRHLSAAFSYLAIAIGAVGMLGYLFAFEILYGLYGYTAMAVHTAAGVVLVGASILISLRRADMPTATAASREGARLTFAITLAVVGVAAAAGIAAFALVGDEMRHEAEQSLASVLQGDRQLIGFEVARRQSDFDRLVSRPILLDGLRALNAQRRGSEAVERMKTMIATLQRAPSVPIEHRQNVALLGIKVIAAEDGESLHAGSITSATRASIPIGEHVAVLWNDGAILRVQGDVVEDGKRLGRLITDYRFDLLERTLQAARRLGRSAVLQVCSKANAGELRCLPDRLLPDRLLPDRLGAATADDAQSLALPPMQRALAGETGTLVYATPGGTAVGAYAPVPDTTLGLVLSRATAELYAPVRMRLSLFALSIAGLVAIALGLVRLRVLPLVRSIDSERLNAAVKNAQLSAVMRTVPDGILTLDADGKILSANPAIARMFGYRPDELLGISCGTLLPELVPSDLKIYSNWSQWIRNFSSHSPDTAQQLDTHSQEFDPATTGAHLIGPTTDELQAKHRNGFSFTVQIGIAELTLDGKPAFVGVVSDITERVRSRAKLNEAFDLLQSTLNSVSVGIAVFGANDKLRVWNGRFVDMIGVAPNRVVPGAKAEELLQQGAVFVQLDEAKPFVPVARIPQKARALADNHAPAGYRSEYRRSDGRVVEIGAQAMPDRGYVMVLADVTALADAEFKHRDQAIRLATTLDSIVDGIVTINESGTIESWSKGAERLLGYRRADVLGRNVNMLMPQPEARAHNGYLRRYLQTREAHVIGQRRKVEALHKDGSRVPVLLGANEMVIGGRRLFVGALTDLSSQLAMERLKSGFVSTVSHELRTPLTSIAGALGLLAGGASGEIPPKAMRMIDIAKNNCDRLIRLINDILDIEKAESGKMEFKLEVQPLRPILQRVVESMQAFADTCGARLQLRLGEATPMVLVDTDRLIQVMTNLISNAAKFSPRDADVTIELDGDAETVRISVRDSGPGIPKEFRTRIFDKFAQADHSDARAVAGTGLGLAISKAIVDRMGGTIGFDTELGRGTTFYVELPSYTPSEDRLLGLSNRLHNVSVLVVEDEREIAGVIEAILVREGAQPIVAPTVRDAARELAACRFDLLIVDLNLPDGSGIDVVKHARLTSDARKLPALLVSAASQPEQYGELTESLHIAAWLSKPVVPARLLRAAREALLQEVPRRPTLLVLGAASVLVDMLRTVFQQEIYVDAAPADASGIATLRRGSYRAVILTMPVSREFEQALRVYFDELGTATIPLLTYGSYGVSTELAEYLTASVPDLQEEPNAMVKLLDALRGRIGDAMPSEATVAHAV